MSLFEQALCLDLQNPKLVAAVCRHETIVDRMTALRRYGHEQNLLALLGDRLVSEVFKKQTSAYKNQQVCEINSTPAPNSNCLSNKYMYHYVHDHGLAKFLYIDTTNFSRKMLYHEYGTFFEAIVAAIYMQKGFKVMEQWCNNYFEEMSIFAQLEPIFSVEQALYKLNRDNSKYIELKTLVQRHFGCHLSVERIKKNQDGYTVEVTFPMPNIRRNTLMRNVHTANRSQLTDAIEGACTNALKNLEQTYFALLVC
jgi:dsRNA-specific ribonuclease